jgi:tRNA pseudouridine38-40 synthase
MIKSSLSGGAWQRRFRRADFQYSGNPGYYASQGRLRFAAVFVYRYTIYNAEVPTAIGRNYSCFCKHELNHAEMNDAAKSLLGEHDFSAFKSSGGSAKTSIRKIYMCNVIQEGNYVYIDIEGNGFLYNMVRIIAGTLIDVGLGRKTKNDIKKILESQDRKLAGKTAVPEGLCLEKIYFIQNKS